MQIAALLATLAAGASGVGDPLFPDLGNGGYDVQHYTLNLRYRSTKPVQDVRGRVAIDALATQALDRLNLDFDGKAVTAVSVDGKRARYARRGEELVITPQSPIAAGARFLVRVSYVSGPRRDGPWFASGPGSVTAAQPDGAHEIFPSNDHPSDLATYTIKADTPAASIFAANGERVRRRSRRGRTAWTYEMRRPMATELIQLAFGNLRIREHGSHSGVHLRDVTRRKEAPRSERALARTPAQLDYMIANAGPFPFAGYGLLLTGEQLSFALESQTLSLFGSLDARARLIDPIMVHELAHQWYGDSVAPARWSDLWLSEGHATWFQWTYTRDRFGANLDEIVKQAYEPGDVLRRRYGPIARPRARTLFSPMVYDSAGVALYALRQEMGDAAFRTLLREWPQRNAGRAVTTADYIAFASEIAGRDLSAFLNAWLYGTTQPPMPGHPDWKASR
jgi:aminopeptidase N